MAARMLLYNHHEMVVVLSFVSGSLVHNLAMWWVALELWAKIINTWLMI